MLEGLVISHVLLWIIVIMLSLVCVALVRQIGVLYERIAPAGALAMNPRLSGGDTAPTLALRTLTDEAVAIGSGRSGINLKSQLLFFLSPTCPVCKMLLPVLKAIHRQERHRLDLILASDGDDVDMHRRFIEKQGLQEFPYVISRPLGLTYGVAKLPYGVLIDEHGIVSALGIVNTREHLESLLEAQALGRATIQDYLYGRAGTENQSETRHPHESA